MRTEQKQKLDQLRSKWKLDSALAQNNKVSYILKRSQADYIRIIGSTRGLTQYQAFCLEETAGVGNHKEVVVAERARIMDIVEDTFENVPEDTVLGKFGTQIQDQVIGVFAKKKLSKMDTIQAEYVPANHNYVDPAGIDVLELSGPYRGCSVIRNKILAGVVLGLFLAGFTTTTANASGYINSHMGQYVEPVEGQKLVVSSTAVQSAMRTTGIYIPQLIYPFDPSTIGDGWGWRAKACGACSEFHQGIDFLPGYGSEIPAVMSGTVTVSEYGGSLGQHVYIDDGYGMVVMYGHMVEGSARVNVGDYVERGQIIGQVGNTGVSTGPHLHLAIQWDGVLMNPLYVLDTFPVRPGLNYG